MNLIIGSSAGTFSTILRFLSWMLVEDISDNDISLYLHWPNKTDFEGNGYCKYGDFYRNIQYDQMPVALLERYNHANDIFCFNNKDLNLGFDLYSEDHVYTIKNLIKTYPDILTRHDGAGWNIKQYFDTQTLSDIRNLYHNMWKKLKISKYMEDEIDRQFEIIQDKKVLTLMIRYSAHYIGCQDDYLNEIVKEVNGKIDDYDNIFLLTQVQEVFDLFMNTYGDKCITPDRRRTTTDWKGNDGLKIMSESEYRREIEECIIDVVLASRTSYIMSGASNMLLGALSINPNISFKIFDCFECTNGA
jgi:hypothetical protein